MYVRSRGNGGLYEYFLCSGRQNGPCTQPHHRMEDVEAAVAAQFRQVELDPAERAFVLEQLERYVAGKDELAAEAVAKAQRQLEGLLAQEGKLLQAHYADQVSTALFERESHRIASERVTAEGTLAKLTATEEGVLGTARTALSLCEDTGRSYRIAGPGIRRLFCQAFFSRIEILEDEGVQRSSLNSPFREMLELGAIQRTVSAVAGGLAQSLANIGEDAETETAAPVWDGGSNFAC